MAGVLYVVATPIGNLNDASPRAVETLRRSDLIACEDTRHTRKLLQRFDVSTPCTSYHEHNEETKTPVLLSQLREGKAISLVSDAGTPLLSDPGYRLVRECRALGIQVIPIPGPFAGAVAASVAGLATDRLLFAGFLSAKAAALKKELQELADLRATLVFYVPPHRLRSTLQAMLEIFGSRRAFLGRELTKLHEEALLGTVEELLAVASGREARGEYTLLVEGAEGPQVETGNLLPINLKAYVTGLMAEEGLSRADAVRRAARELGLSRRLLYQRMLEDQTMGQTS